MIGRGQGPGLRGPGDGGLSFPRMPESRPRLPRGRRPATLGSRMPDQVRHASLGDACPLTPDLRPLAPELRFLEYVHQRADDLVYGLFRCAAPRDLVRVLQERRVRLDGWKATIAIIGSSHFLEMCVSEQVTTEMLASARPGLSALPLVATGASSELRRSETLPGGLDYRFELDWQRCGVAEFETESRGLSTPAAGRLVCEFPAGEGEPPALTCVEWRAAGTMLAVRTYHTFPGEYTIVRSRSLVELPERGVGH